MFGFLGRLCSKHGKTPLDAELRRQRNALKAINQFVHSIQRCLRYWEKSGKALRVGITGYFYDKPAYQRPVEEISAALKPQLDLIKKANADAARSIAKVEKASRRKKDAEKRLLKKEAGLRKLQQKAETGKDPQAGHKVKTAEDEVQVARNCLQMAEAELAREMQQTMNGSAPEAAMQVARALEAMILFLAGSGVDVAAVRASIRLLEETQYFSPLTHPGGQASQQLQQQQLQQQHSVISKAERQQQSQQPPQHQPYRACSKNAFSKLPPSRQPFRARLADYSTTAAIFPGRKPSSASSSSLYWELERLISFA
ncbi:hypothetical protein, conserved [Eimeria acervulina]|uniref:Uncharacterized protein n=1 Tax=Eimeria acervulina TaxID=5801 RepID=U6GRC8_EIMAC|nr:hypothetical protein, conserved [Eimeria acervulina]CDI82811.1 hypothetical protein, conserved [Eimeria acervulina]